MASNSKNIGNDVNLFRDFFSDILENLKSGSTDPETILAASSAGARILSSVKLELTYNKFLDKKNEIKFLEGK